MVFVPGLGLDADEYRSVRDRLGASSVVVPLPSLGKPARRRTDLRVETQAGRVRDSLGSLGMFNDDTPTILVGHSASCPVVVEVARRWGSVVGLVLVGPVTDPTAQTWPRMLAQWGRTAVHERPAEARTLARQYRRTGPISMLRGMNSVRRYRTDLGLEGLKLPVEVVRGQQDRIATHEWSSHLARAADARLTTVAGAAHMVPLTHPEALVAAVERIRSTTGPAMHPVVSRGAA